MARGGGHRQLDYARLHARVAEFHEQARSADALAIHRKILRDGNPHALGLFGRTAARYRANAMAIRLLEQAVVRGAEKADDFNELGLACLDSRRFDEAIDHFEQARLREPEEARFGVNIALALQEQGALDDALAILDEIGIAHAEETAVLLRRAELQLRRGQPEPAVAALARLRDRTQNPTWRLSLELIAHAEQGDFDAVADVLRFDDFVQQVAVEVAPGFSGAEDFNRRLRKHVVRLRSMVTDPDGYSTRHGRHSLGNLLRDRSEAIRGLEFAIARAVERYRAALPAPDGHPFLACGREFRIEAWAVVLGREGHHVSHIHRDGWLSGVYYVDVADVVCADDPEREGWLELGQGPADLHALGSTVPSEWVCPRDGVFVLFPSYCWHRTNPFCTRGERVAIAFDVIPNG